MTCRRSRCERGVTLVELLIALTIAVLVLAPLAGMLQTSVTAGAAHAGRARLEQDLRFALDRIAAEVQSAPRKVLSPQQTALADTDNWFPTSRFYVNTAKQLIEVRDGVNNIIAEPVASFSVSARTVGADATIVEARLRLARDADSVQGGIAVRMGGPRK